MAGASGPLGLRVTRDHVVPVSRGGRETVFSCVACNEVKGDMMPDEWAEFQGANPEWWTLWKDPEKPRVPPTALDEIWRDREAKVSALADTEGSLSVPLNSTTVTRRSK